MATTSATPEIKSIVSDSTVSQLPTPELTNVVGSANLGRQIDLVQVVQRGKMAEYNPKRFPGAILRMLMPFKATALVFKNGKIVCTGTKSEEQCKKAAKTFAKNIQKIMRTVSKNDNFKLNFHNFRIRNMVAKCDVKFPVRLEGLQLDHEAFAEYEPELFPGLVYRMINPKVVLLIFVSGKVVITGGKSVKDINTAFQNIHPVLSEYRKKDS